MRKTCNAKCDEEVDGFGRVYIGRRSRLLLEDRVFTRIDDVAFSRSVWTVGIAFFTLY